MWNTIYIIFVIILLIVLVIQYVYIQRLKNAIRYAVKVLTKYESALLMDDIIRKVNENDESKTSKVVSK